MNLLVQIVHTRPVLRRSVTTSFSWIADLILPNIVLVGRPMVQECGNIIDVADLRAQHLNEIMLCA